ncbi:MAG: LD-carboxypeptidase [bacterium]
MASNLIPQIIKPRRLPPNGTIGIVSPASPMEPEKLQKGIGYLEKLGYRVEVGNAVFKRDGYLAGSDEDRIADIEEMFIRKDIDAIFCSRGGYGTPRLLPKMNYELIRQNPKIFVGYSDLTALQMAIFWKTGLVTFSGPMVAVEFASGIDAQTEENFWRLICEANPYGKMPPLAGKYKVHSGGENSGRILAGCLSVLAGIAGTQYFPFSYDCVLLLEDIGEKPYRIDHYLAQLKNAGLLKAPAGVLAGQFSDCVSEEGKPSWSIEEIFEDYFGETGYPAIAGFDYGHQDVKHTIPIGIRVKLATDPVEIEVLENAVTL